jgi:PTS system nitrogen regulatory IIA component
MSDLSSWLDRDSVVEQAGADTERGALAVIAETAARSFGLPAADILERLVAREAQGSTGVGHGVAVPHAALPGLDRMRAVFVRLKTPVAFGAVDDEPVDLLLALFAPAGANDGASPAAEHLRLLAKVSRLLRGREVRDLLRQARSADALYAILTQEQAVSAA